MKKIRTTAILILSAMLVLAGCGSNSSSMGGYAAKEAAYDSEGAYATSDYAYEEAVEAPEEGDSFSPTDEVNEDNTAKPGAKIIRNASLSINVDDLSSFAEELKKTVSEYDGYVESSDVNDYDSDYSEYRYGYFTVRVPATKLDAFLGIVEGRGEVTSKNESAEDVTLQYVDLEAHIETYEAERESLKELLDKADSVEDILAIRSELNDINYELDSLQRQLKAMENKVSYSTVTINATESRSISVSKQSFASKFFNKFADEFSEGMEMASDFLIFIVTRIPFFILLGLFIFAIVKAVLAIVRSAKKQKEKKPASGGMISKLSDDKTAENKSTESVSAGAVVAGGATQNTSEHGQDGNK